MRLSRIGSIRPRVKRYDVAIDVTLGHSRRILASWLGMLVLAFNVSATDLLASDTRVLDLSGDTVICTPAGLITVTPDGHVDRATTSGGICIFCLPLMNATVVAPASQDVVAFHAQDDDHLPPPREIVSNTPCTKVRGPSPRAPPTPLSA